MLWATEAMQEWKHKRAEDGHWHPSKKHAELIKKSPSLPGKKKPGRPKKTEEAPKKARKQSQLQNGKKQAPKKKAASRGAKQKLK